VRALALPTGLTSTNEAMTTRHPTSRRVHRPDPAPDDAFVAGVLETTAWARQHQRTLIVGGIVLAVLITALVVWLNWRTTHREQANLRLTQVRAVALSGNNELAIRELQEYLDTYGGTPVAGEARLLLGRVYLQTGQPGEAAEAVRPAARNAGSALGADAAFLLAAAYEAAQEPHRAEEVYLRIGDDGRFLFQRQEALDHAARIRMQRADAAGAVQLYQRLMEMTPETSPDRQIFELRLGEAQAAAAAPAQPAATPQPAAPAPPEPAAPAGN
jgi:cytochrome c-type biogenesis protein CcmH/NrfG